MNTMNKFLGLCGFALCGLAFADGTVKSSHPVGPCKEIVKACKGAGFVKGDFKNGDGLYRDCVNPIIQNVTTVPGATKTLPTVPAETVAACKTLNPQFGAGKIGTAATTK